MDAQALLLVHTIKPRPDAFKQGQGQGHHYHGAIGHRLPFGVFGIAKSTYQVEVGEFLKRLRGAVSPSPFTNNERIVLVVDNHPSHGTVHVRELA